MATATTQPYPAMRKILPRRVSRALEVAQTHIAMFGYVSAARAALSKFIAPKFQRVQQFRPIPRNWTWTLWRHV